MFSSWPNWAKWGLLCCLSVSLSLEAFAVVEPKNSLRKLQANPHIPIGFQSGPDPGATYGGKVIYRPNTNRIYITGASYGNFFKSTDAVDSTNTAADVANCFLGIAELPKAADAQQEMNWLHSQQWDTIAPEACNMIHVDRNPVNLPENNTNIEEKIYLIGYSSPNGLMENMRVQSAFPSEQYGMIMDIDIVTKPAAQQGMAPFTTTFWGGRLLQDGPVQYPVDMTIDEEGYLYVASMQSWNTNPTTELSVDEAKKLVVDPAVSPLGSGYNMLVQQFLYDNPGYDDGIGLPKDPSNVELQTTIIDNWRKPFGLASGTGGVSVSGIQYLGGLLVVVGSTAGRSQVFGNDLPTKPNRTDTSVNGFITKLIPESGTYFEFNADNGAQIAGEQPLHKRSSTAIMSLDSKDDHIMGMCSSPEADPNNFYIVGTTTGQIAQEVDMFVKDEVHAFIMKVNLWTLLPVWTKQIGADPTKKAGVHGMSCAVTADGNDVYLAGVVENGGALSLWEQTSFGGDDIFLFQAKTEDGRLEFIRQIGTSGNDRLSPGGLTTDQLGNAILMGHTDGSFYRARQHDQESEKKSDDLFIMTVARNTGDYKEPEVVDNSTPNTPTETDTPADNGVFENLPDLENPTDEKPTTQSPQGGTTTTTTGNTGTIGNTGLRPADPSKPVETYNAFGEIDRTNEANKKEDEVTKHDQSGQRYGLMVFFVLVATIAAAAGLFAYKKVLDNRDRPTEREHVLQYLHDFDVDDIDLKHSATGGWHCSYTNDLAHGINARAASRGEGLFGGLSGSYSYNPNNTNDPLIGDPREAGEISFQDERDGDDISSIGSGVTGKHSTRDGPKDLLS